MSEPLIDPEQMREHMIQLASKGQVYLDWDNKWHVVPGDGTVDVCPGCYMRAHGGCCCCEKPFNSSKPLPLTQQEIARLGVEPADKKPELDPGLEVDEDGEIFCDDPNCSDCNGQV